jgi:lipoprotein-releasing system ATP-binding protein
VRRADAQLTNPVSQRVVMPMLRGDVLEAHGVHKSYQKAKVHIPVLRGVDLRVEPGEFLAIVGQSGSGKSTLLHLLGTLDAPDVGEVRLGAERIDNLSRSRRDKLRNLRFGMVFQMYHLLPELTALENVLVPTMISQSVWQFMRQRKQHLAAATELLELVGLGHRLRHLPRELSGGEMQRTAVARALVNRPGILLADEPTGNLDDATGQEILDLLRTLNQHHNLTIVMVTHDESIARMADRVVRLAGGQVRDVVAGA